MAFGPTPIAQAIGKIPADVDDLGVELSSLAGHKFYAPTGVGALYVRDGMRYEPSVLSSWRLVRVMHHSSLLTEACREIDRTRANPRVVLIGHDYECTRTYP